MVLATAGRTKRGLIDRLINRKDFQITDYLSADGVAFLESTSSEDAINSLVDRLYRTEKIHERALFTKALLLREDQSSTAIGDGIAIPHARSDSFDHFFLAIGLVRSENLVWDASHSDPVRIIFLIGGPDNRPDEYLQILSHLTTAVKSTEERAALLACQTPQQVLSYLSKY